MLKEFDGQIYVSGWMQKATKCLEEVMNLENKTFLYLSDKPYATVRLRVPVLVSRQKKGDFPSWLSKSSDTCGLGWKPRLKGSCLWYRCIVQEEHRWRDTKLVETPSSAGQTLTGGAERTAPQIPNNPFCRETEKSVYKMFKQPLSRRRQLLSNYSKSEQKNLILRKILIESNSERWREISPPISSWRVARDQDCTRVAPQRTSSSSYVA